MAQFRYPLIIVGLFSCFNLISWVKIKGEENPSSRVFFATSQKDDLVLFSLQSIELDPKLLKKYQALMAEVNKDSSSKAVWNDFIFRMQTLDLEEAVTNLKDLPPEIAFMARDNILEDYNIVFADLMKTSRTKKDDKSEKEKMQQMHDLIHKEFPRRLELLRLALYHQSKIFKEDINPMRK